MSDRPDWGRMLREGAPAYAGVALANIGREFPTMVFHVMSGTDDLPGRPRTQTPVFYGSFDWHSCVEMHWLLVRLLRVAGDVVPAAGRLPGRSPDRIVRIGRERLRQIRREHGISF